MHVHLQVGFAGLRSNDLVPKCNLQDHVVWKTTESSYSFAVSALLFLFLRGYYCFCCCGCCCCHFLTAPSCRETFSSHFPGLLLAPWTKQLSDALSIRTTTHPPMLISKYTYIYMCIKFCIKYSLSTPFMPPKRSQKTINFNWFGPARWYDLLLPQDPALVHPSWWRSAGLIGVRYQYLEA